MSVLFVDLDSRSVSSIRQLQSMCHLIVAYAFSHWAILLLSRPVALFLSVFIIVNVSSITDYVKVCV
eukprot:3939872-Pleurochrysis_carterae.AAC.1